MTTTKELEKRVNDHLLMDDRVFPADISVEALDDATIKLYGTVPTFTSLRAAEEDAFFVPGVREVQNELKVMVPEEITAPTDDEIADRIKRIYEWHENLRSFDLIVDVDSGWVTLGGSVGSYWKKIIAEDLAYTVTGVVEVTNEITIVPTHDHTDESIALHIKEKIKVQEDLNVEDIDIKVANGEVTLSGTVDTHSDAIAAYEAAIYTRGVTEVNDDIVVRRDVL